MCPLRRGGRTSYRNVVTKVIEVRGVCRVVSLVLKG